MQPKFGGKSHLKLNICRKPIANKYREGKMKRTLKRESKVLEIVDMETVKIFNFICMEFNLHPFATERREKMYLFSL